MARVYINASAYGTPGEVVAVEDGLIVWTGTIEHIHEAGGFDALFCHDDDEERLNSLLSAPNRAAARPRARR
jgi:hypothetical protein